VRAAKLEISNEYFEDFPQKIKESEGEELNKNDYLPFSSI